MTISDEAKLFVVRQKLLEAERTIYEANKIIAFIGGEPDERILNCDSLDFGNDSCTLPIDENGLYPGQLEECVE